MLKRKQEQGFRAWRCEEYCVGRRCHVFGRINCTLSIESLDGDVWGASRLVQNLDRVL